MIFISFVNVLSFVCDRASFETQRRVLCPNMINDQNKIKVCIQCATFNQSRYIEDAMNGFVMQETDFPFVAVIVDDASTDDEPLVLRNFYYRFFDYENSAIAYQEETEYGRILYAQHRTNKNCFFAVVLLNENHYSKHKSKSPYWRRWTIDAKYIALCEGDDYWIDSSKLQKQVDFLEEHEECSLCCHRYKIYNQDSDTWEDDYVKKLFEFAPKGFSFTRADNLKTWITKTMTLVYRSDKFDPLALKSFKYGCDEHMNYILLSHGDGYCFPFVGAVYRRTDSGVFSTLSNEQKMKRGILIKGELLESNLRDVSLREDVTSRLFRYLYGYDSISGIWKSICACLHSFWITRDWKSFFLFSKKIIRLTLRVLCNRLIRSVNN